jgi:hypothetical protein
MALNSGTPSPPTLATLKPRLIAYEKDLFSRSASAAAEADRNLKLFFDENAPQSVVDLFTNYSPSTNRSARRQIEASRSNVT